MTRITAILDTWLDEDDAVLAKRDSSYAFDLLQLAKETKVRVDHGAVTETCDRRVSKSGTPGQQYSQVVYERTTRR